MHSSVFGVVHVGLAAGVTLLSLWAADVPLMHKATALAAGLVLGSWAGVVADRRLARRVDRGGGVVLYVEAAAWSALAWPLGVLALFPFAFGTMLRTVGRSPDLQLVLQVSLCGVTAAWLAHDLMVARGLRRLNHTLGPLRVQWFHARSAVGPEAMIGKSGVVTAPCAPTGYIRVAGEIWRAESIDGASLSVGQDVKVRRLNGLALLIEAADAEASAGPPHSRSGGRAG